MSDGFEAEPEFVQTKQFPMMFWGGVTLAIVSVLFYIGKNEPEFVRKIAAEPYVWPAGCEEKEYKQFEPISPKCFQDQYFLGSGAEYGWFRSKYGSTKYYRVGNDAMSPSASCKHVGGSDCKSNEYVKDVFVVSGESK